MTTKTFDKKRNRWIVRKKVGDKRKYMGSFKTQEEAEEYCVLTATQASRPLKQQWNPSKDEAKVELMKEVAEMCRCLFGIKERSDMIPTFTEEAAAYIDAEIEGIGRIRLTLQLLY